MKYAYTIIVSGGSWDTDSPWEFPRREVDYYYPIPANYDEYLSFRYGMWEAFPQETEEFIPWN